MGFKRRKIAVGVLAVLAAACTSGGGSTGELGGPGPIEARVSIRVEGGGQTGGEGSCLGGPEQPLAFSAADVQALVLGRHETTLAHRPSWRSVSEAGEPGKAMIIEVSARGEPEAEKVCSSWVMKMPVEMKLSLDEPALDVIIEHTLIAYRADVAELSVQLPAQVAEQMGLTEARLVPSWAKAEQEAYFSIWFGGAGVRGDVNGGANCGSLVFPAGRTCVHAGGFPIDTDDSLQEALAAFDALSALPVTLPDGTSTTLSVERQGEPARLCGRPHPLSMLRRAPLSARVRSDDGRIDLVVAGELIFEDWPGHVPGAPYPAPEELKPEGPRAWSFQANGFLPAQSAQAIAYYSDLSERQLAMLSLALLNLNSNAPSARLQLGTVTANETGRKIAEPLWVSESSAQGPSCFDASMVPDVGAPRD